MAKWVIILVGLALVVGIGAGTAFALTGDGAGSTEGDPLSDAVEPSGVQPPIRSDEDIDPDDRGDTPLEVEPGGGIGSGAGPLPADPPLEVEPGGGIGSGAGPPPADPPIRSDEDIDPNECNLVHNINACDEDDLKALGATPILGSSPLAPGSEEVEGEPEPLYVDGEPGYEVQSHEEAVEQDCGLAGGSVYVSSDGEVGCVIAHDLKDGGEEVTQGQLPKVEPLVP
ncbi:MAG: hypothetical protein V3U79_12105 [Dehalococcoidia bacterium]